MSAKGRKKKLDAKKKLLTGIAALIMVILGALFPQVRDALPASLQNLLPGMTGSGTATVIWREPEGFSWEDAPVRVHFIDVGQGDAVLLETPSQWTLVDGGDNGQEQDLLAYLESVGVSQLDTVIASHYHTDHIGGLPEVLAGFSVGQLLAPVTVDDLLPTSRTYERLLTTAEEKSIPFYEVFPGDVIDIGDGAALTVLSPLGRNYEDLNETSLVCRLTYQNNSLLLTGDTEAINEEEMLAAYSRSDLQCQVMKLGHHGSNTSNTAGFLQAVSPSVTVATAGKNNDYGHPHQEVVERVEDIGAHLLRSDLHGDIVVAFDGEDFSLRTEKQPAA